MPYITQFVDEERFLFSFVSDSRAHVLRALIKSHGELEVKLYLERGHMSDSPSVAVVVDIDEFVVGGKKYYFEDIEMSIVDYVGQRIGYASNRDLRTHKLVKDIEISGKPMDARLVLVYENEYLQNLWILSGSGESIFLDEDEDD